MKPAGIYRMGKCLPIFYFIGNFFMIFEIGKFS